jgi:exosome complex RNA-binding protein Rrp42 (RNase PH superfamily)
MVNVELGAMASPAFEAGGRPDDAAVELARVLERGLKQSGA